MKQGEIWFVKYDPSIGHEFKKTRPAIILSSNNILKYANVITVIAITGSSNNKISDDLELKKDDKNNLFSDSTIKIHHINSFDKSRFIKRIGEIEDEKLKEIKAYLINYFEL